MNGNFVGSDPHGHVRGSQGDRERLARRQDRSLLLRPAQVSVQIEREHFEPRGASIRSGEGQEIFKQA